jgi:hypothetical protein
MAKHKVEAGSRFEGLGSVSKAAQIKTLSPTAKKARGILKALRDSRYAHDRAVDAARAKTEQVEVYAAQVADLEEQLRALPADDDE